MAKNGKPKQFSPHEEREIVRRYRLGDCISLLACRYGCAFSTIFRILRDHGEVIRDDRSRHEHVPSPEEIGKQTARLREQWDEAEYRARAGLSREPEPYVFPRAMFSRE